VIVSHHLHADKPIMRTLIDFSCLFPNSLINSKSDHLFISFLAICNFLMHYLSSSIIFLYIRTLYQ
jgi:hypothetical protein